MSDGTRALTPTRPGGAEPDVLGDEEVARSLTVLPPHRLSVVVPMFNEIDNVKPLLNTMQAALADYPQPWELIVVDDGSVDGTGAALQREAALAGPHVRVLRLTRNFRQTAAMQAGIDAARGDVIVTMDGTPVPDVDTLQRLLAADAIARPIEVLIVRRDRTLNVTVTPVESAGNAG